MKKKSKLKYTKDFRTEQYKLIKKIGEGGEAEIWKAQEINFPQITRALKLKPPIHFEERGKKYNEIRDKIHKEAESWLKFDSIYITNLYGVIAEMVEVEGEKYLICGIAMEYSEKGDLNKFLINREIKKHLNTELFFIDFLLFMIKGLQSGHNQNVVHCDIKPKNILLFCEDDILIPKITDFGISRAFYENNIGGTEKYMAPELKKEMNASPSILSDVYSLGIMFYEIFYYCYLDDKEGDIINDFECGEDFKSNIETLIEKTTKKVNISIEKYINIFSSMVKEIPEERISLSDVKYVLEVRKRNLLSKDNIDFKVVNKDIYRWNPLVHKMLEHQLYFVFINGGFPVTDIDNLNRNLQDEQLFGYSIHSMIGAIDFFLRIWINEQLQKDRLKRALEMYANLSEGRDYTILKVREFKLFQNSPSIDSEIKDSESLLKNIRQCVDIDDRDKEFENLKKSNFVLSRIDNEDNNHFRVFVSITVVGLADKIISLIGNQLHRIIKDNNQARETSMYLIEGNKDNIRIILKFKHADFLACKEILMSIYNEGESYRQQDRHIRFGYKTFFHMNSNKDNLSDDGKIIEDLIQFGI